MSHAYIFSGPEHVGKLIIAKKLAKSFFCAEMRAGEKIFEDVCETCISCIQIEKDQHKNVFFLDTEHTITSKKEIRKDIPIDDIRELKHQFSLSSGDGARRMVIINEAEKLSDYAVNALLKLLEEPPEKSLFILITAHEELLLSTIFSRAPRIQFGLVAEEKLVSYARAEGLNESRARDAARLACKRPGVLVRLCQDKGFFEAMGRKAGFMDRMLRSSIPDIFRAAEKIAEDPVARRDAVWFLFAALRKAFILKATEGDAISFLDSIKKIDHMQYCMETTNVNSRLALEALFMEAKKVYYRNRPIFS